jgi:hypothetical protein
VGGWVGGGGVRDLPGRKAVHHFGFSLICWAIWKSRNKVIFDKKIIKHLVEIIMHACAFMLYWAGLFEPDFTGGVTGQPHQGPTRPGVVAAPGPSPISAAVFVIVASWFPFRRWITFLRYFCNWRYILPNWEGLNKLAINLIAGLKDQTLIPQLPSRYSNREYCSAASLFASLRSRRTSAAVVQRLRLLLTRIRCERSLVGLGTLST